MPKRDRPKHSHPLYPPIAFRVGVTGSRLPVSPGARVQVVDILKLVRDKVEKVAADLRAIDPNSTANAALPALRLVSPLAEGSDRVVAEAADELGYQLYAPLPFPQAEYEKDFPESVGPFRQLLARSEVFELDGGRGDFEAASYEEAGRFVVRNCDLLIAIWDGLPARGRGGTAEIVSYAIRAGVPVWWIDANEGEPPPRLIAGFAELKDKSRALAGADAGDAMRRAIERILLPPESSPPQREGAMGRVVSTTAWLTRYDPSPLEAFASETGARAGGIWRTYQRFMRLLAPRPPGNSPVMLPAEGAMEIAWNDVYLRANAASEACGDHYRSSYLLIIAAAFLAVFFAVISAWAEGERAEILLAGLEVGFLLVIAGLVMINQWKGWHEKWITYRLLAELCRKQRVLSGLGRCLPISEINRILAEAAAGPRPRELWAGWYFAALQRAARLPTGSSAEAKRRAFELSLSLVEEQENYHAIRRDRSHFAATLLGEFGEWFFLMTMTIIVVRLGLLLRGWQLGSHDLIEATALVFSAASAGLIGMRAYAEFGLLVRQSARMLRVLRESKDEIEEIGSKADAALATRDLGSVVYRLALSMMQDEEGWAQLFRIKTVEAG